MTEKRDARGTLRDYEKRSERELFPIFFSLFQGLEIFIMAFSPAPLFKPDSDSPGRCFSPLDITNSTHTALSVSTTKESGIMCIPLWRDKTKILSSIIEPISIDMVNKSPTIFWFPYDMIMDKVASKSSIAIVAFIELCSDKLLLINIFIKNGMADKFVFVIIQRGFYYITIDNSVMEYSILSDWWNKIFVSSFGSPVMELAESFCKVWAITPWNCAYHSNIISKNYKISRRDNG